MASLGRGATLCISAGLGKSDPIPPFTAIVSCLLVHHFHAPVPTVSLPVQQVHGTALVADSW